MSDLTDMEWRVVAKRTARWMKQEKFIHDYENNRRFHMTRHLWIEEFGETYDLVEADWPRCVMALYKEGINVGYDFGRGFFLCKPEDAGSYFSRLVNYWYTLGNTINELIEAAEQGGEWEGISEGLKGKLRISDISGLPTSFEAIGIEVGAGVIQALTATQNLLTEARDRFQEKKD